MSEQYQYHLKGRGHSGRAIRVEGLSAHDVEDQLTGAAKLAGPEATGLEIKKIEWRNGCKLFVKSFTEPCADPMAEGVKWKKATPMLLENISDYFTAKDCAILETLYREYHDVTPSEILSITQGMLPVSGD